MRMELEQKLGLEVLIKCYDVVQVSASVGVNFGCSRRKVSLKKQILYIGGREKTRLTTETLLIGVE